MKFKLDFELSPDEIRALERYAQATYRPGLEINWRHVAQGWAESYLHDQIAKMSKHYHEPKPTTAGS